MRENETIEENDTPAFELSFALSHIANAITPLDAGSGRDAAGGHVSSLTEAVMGITAGLFRVAEAIEYHADSNQSLNAGIQQSNVA